jgi:hypothetical protein
VGRIDELLDLERIECGNTEQPRSQIQDIADTRNDMATVIINPRRRQREPESGPLAAEGPTATRIRTV